MNIKVSGTGTKVEIFLRGRCQGYGKYMQSVGHCAATADDPCMETNTRGKTNWIGAAQSYIVKQCGAAAGEANEYEGPPCSTMEECTAMAQAQQQKEKEAAGVKAPGAAAMEGDSVAPLLSGAAR